MNIPEIIIDCSQLHFKPFEDVAHSESDIYIYDNSMYKIINKNLRLSRESIVRELYQLQCEGAANPTAVLVDHHHQFIGYVMKYYQFYHTLLQANLSIEEKIMMIKKMYDIYKKFLQKGLLYVDIHVENIIISNENIGNIRDMKYVDMDSIKFIKDMSWDDYQYYLFRKCQKLFLTSFSILIGEDIANLPFDSSQSIIDYFAYFQQPLVDQYISSTFADDVVKRKYFPAYFLDDHLHQLDFEKVISLSNKRKKCQSY